jgi:hypothetical protein
LGVVREKADEPVQTHDVDDQYQRNANDGADEVRNPI